MKKSMFLSVALLVVSIIAFAGSTIAYFTNTKQTTAVFTSGNVEISMTEAAIQRDAVGNIVADPTSPRVHGTPDGTVHNYGIVHPGQSISKDPLVKNTGNSAAWVAVKVTLTDGKGDICKLLGYDPDLTDMIDIELLLSGGLLDEKITFGVWNGVEDVCYNDHYAMIQAASRAEGKYEFYFYILNPMSPGESFFVFDQMLISGEWNNEEMNELSEFNINVCAYAVQTYGFSDCYTAMKTAFSQDFQ